MANQTNPKKGPMKTPKSKAQAFAEYRKKNGEFHPADPKNPMNGADRTASFETMEEWSKKNSGMKYGGKPKKMKNGGATCKGMGAASRGGKYRTA